MKLPVNDKENREILANILVKDISIPELKERVLNQLLYAYTHTAQFIEDYNVYFEETGGHCPFGINGE